MERLLRIRRLAIMSVLVLGGGCFVNPQFDGESVRCATDTDCEHLDGTFVCDSAAGLCVRIDDGTLVCEPACLDGQTCADGTCVEDVTPACPDGCPPGHVCDEEINTCVGEPDNCDPACHALDVCTDTDEGWTCRPGPLRVVVDSPEHRAWVRNEVDLTGTIRFGDEDSPISVTCGFEGDARTGTTGEPEPHPEDEGVWVAEWTCVADLTGREEGIVDVPISASGTERTGATERSVRRDVTDPVITALTVTPERGTPDVLVPQDVTVHVEAEDRMGTGEGRVARIALQVTAPSGYVVYERTCEETAAPEKTCTGTFAFLSDLEAAEDWKTEDGAYLVRAVATDVSGNPENEDEDTSAVSEATFHVIRRPDVGVFVAKAPEVPADLETLAIRRHEAANVQIRSSRPEQIVGAPRIEIRQAGLSDDGACVEAIDLDDRLESGDEEGVWNLELSAMEPCLPSGQKAYMVAVVVEDAWTHDPNALRDVGDVRCETDNDACATVVVRRALWDPIDLCSGRDDCRVLTPAVAPDGAIYVAYDYIDGSGHTHGVSRVPIASGVASPWWTPTSLTRFTLSGGPVVQPRGSGGGDRVYLTGPGVLLALRTGEGGTAVVDWPYPALDNATTEVIGPPAIGQNGAVYIPIAHTAIIIEPGDDAPLSEGGLAVVNPQSGEAYAAPYLLGDPMEAGTRIALRQGGESEWAALFDPRGRGGRVECPWPSVACNGRASSLPSGRRGYVAARTQGYLVGHASMTITDFLDQFPWNRSSFGDDPSWTLSNVSIEVGPVFDGTRLVVAGLGNFTISSMPIAGVEPEYEIVDLGGRVPQGLALGTGGVYLLYDDGTVEARDHAGELLWSLEAEAPAAGTDLNFFPLQSAEGDAVGILLVASQGQLHAFVTDDAGPSSGWPLERGDPGRRAVAPAVDVVDR